MKELTLLQAETEALGSTPLDPVPEYARAVMRLRLKSAELASRAAQSALLHTVLEDSSRAARRSAAFGKRRSIQFSLRRSNICERNFPEGLSLQDPSLH
jgi:hypothetical protein